MFFEKIVSDAPMPTWQEWREEFGTEVLYLLLMLFFPVMVVFVFLMIVVAQAAGFKEATLKPIETTEILFLFYYFALQLTLFVLCATGATPMTILIILAAYVFSWIITAGIPSPKMMRKHMRNG